MLYETPVGSAIREYPRTGIWWRSSIMHTKGMMTAPLLTVDRAGNKKTLTGEFVSVQGVAWWPGGNEIWFTGTT